MRKLLIMASLFYPQKRGGGPPVSIKNIVDAIKDDFEIYVISHNYEVGAKESLHGICDGWNEFEFGRVYYFPYGKHTPKNIYRLICEIKPDVIYQNSFFSYDDVFPVLAYKRKNKSVGIVIAPRGEICENRFNIGKLKKSIYAGILRKFGFLKNVYFQATGADEVKDLEKILKIKPEFIFNINNFSLANEKYITGIKKEKGSLRLCYIARIQEIKNLVYAVERLADVCANIVYDVYGSVESREYYDKCFSYPLPENISLNYCGMIEHDEVGKTICKYHAFFMPTIGENYGHSIVEALMYKRPVIISDKTPWSDVEKYGCGYAIALDKQSEFEKAVEHMAALGQEEFDQMCENSKQYIEAKLNNKEIIRQYVQCFNEV